MFHIHEFLCLLHVILIEFKKLNFLGTVVFLLVHQLFFVNIFQSDPFRGLFDIQYRSHILKFFSVTYGGFPLGSKTKETLKSSYPIGCEQNYGPKEIKLCSNPKYEKLV